MRIFYDTTDSNQVKAFYTGDTTSTAWAAYGSLITTDKARISEVLQYCLNCRLTIVEGEVTAVTQFETEAYLRATLRTRVSREYDDLVKNGIANDVTWSTEDLVVLDRDVELLGAAIAVAAYQLANGDIVGTDVVLPMYKFGDGIVKAGITAEQLIELDSTYKTNRGTWFAAHLTVKGNIDAGALPASADYTAVGLVLADFDNLGLV